MESKEEIKNIIINLPIVRGDNGLFGSVKGVDDLIEGLVLVFFGEIGGEGDSKTIF